MSQNYFLLFVLFIYGCFETQIEDAQYSFFVAGHIYGAHGEGKNNIGVHPPFKDKLDLIRDNESIQFGVFTGDLVEDGKDENEWDELDMDISYIGKKIYFAPGNHDVGNSTKKAIYQRRYGKTYYSFIHKSDLFITLDPNMDKWNISGNQLKWLRELVASKSGEVDNIFVFFHQVLWWKNDNIFKNFELNSVSGRDEEINFWDDIYSLFENTNKPTFMFAGDTGDSDVGYMYHKEGNIVLIASGMGGGKEDNFIIVNVNKDKSVDFDLIALNGSDLNGLGRLEDYVLP
ncbi:metallophosphoesterase family protein [Flagellimonas onchidii]|uniref:metallophosphoesterase family protein n=1 Tax=Flagellimonas onchidii TaxID=2562684 RepID=UPI0010A5E9C5|nr:metallophosphoesterase [Allomuricauda onchidii]